MQFESDFRFDMDDGFSMCSQAMSCPSAGTSFSSASSAYDPFTPTSRRSTPNELALDFDATQFAGSHAPELTSPSHGMPKYMFAPAKPEPEHMAFPNGMPSTPVKRMDGMATPDYDHMLEMNMASQHSMGSVTPSGPYPMYTISPHATMGPTSFMMTPTNSLSGSEVADSSSSSWSCANDSPISFSPHKSLASHEFDALPMERQSQSPLERYQLQGPPSPVACWGRLISASTSSWCRVSVRAR